MAKKGSNSLIIIVILAVIGIGVFLYVRNKKAKDQAPRAESKKAPGNIVKAAIKENIVAIKAPTPAPANVVKANTSLPGITIPAKPKAPEPVQTGVIAPKPASVPAPNSSPARRKAQTFLKKVIKGRR